MRRQLKGVPFAATQVDYGLASCPGRHLLTQFAHDSIQSVQAVGAYSVESLFLLKSTPGSVGFGRSPLRFLELPTKLPILGSLVHGQRVAKKPSRIRFVIVTYA